MRISPLPEGVQHMIYSKLSPVTKARTHIMQEDPVETILQEWKRMIFFKDPQENRDFILLSADAMTNFGKGAKRSYSFTPEILIDKETHKIIHIEVSLHTNDFAYILYWNSPQDLLPHLGELFSHPGFNISTNTNSGYDTGNLKNAYFKNWIYTSLILFHMRFPEHVTSEIYTHIMTRFRQKELLNLYPPVKLPAVNPPMTRTAFLENYQNMEGVKGYTEAVRTFLKPKPSNKRTRTNTAKETPPTKMPHTRAYTASMRTRK